MADAPKKPSTAEILAKLRAETAKAKGEAAPEAAAPAAAPATPTTETPAAATPAPAAGAKPKPKTPAEILAAARAEVAAKAAGGTAATPAAAATSGEKPKPKTPAEILAAARAEVAAKAAGGAPAPAATAAAPAATAKAAPAAAVAVPAGMSVADMIQAARPAEVAPAAPAPVKAVTSPVMPARPVMAKKKGSDDRRTFLQSAGALLTAMFLTPFGLAWTLLTLWTGGATLFIARFMLPNVLTEPPRKFKIGPPSDYDLGTVATKWVAAYGVWIVHTDQYKAKNMIYALASVCTHLGCTPSWLEGEQKFKCPCHGSGFYITGVNFEGPAPRPLERVGIRLAEDGMLEVDKSLKFQEEMGQWTDGNSFVEIT